MTIAAFVALTAGLPEAAAGPKPVTAVSADRIVVLKRARRLVLLSHGKVLRAYRIALGRRPVGPKVRDGDGRTPEGRYVLDWRNARSRFYRSMHISYPNRKDRERARRLGVPAGGDIMIHGLPNDRAEIGPKHARMDWTEGCIAVTNAEMDEIWNAVKDGTTIEIRP
jgi:murein L,D-transpeptidase YafK